MQFKNPPRKGGYCKGNKAMMPKEKKSPPDGTSRLVSPLTTRSQLPLRVRDGLRRRGIAPREATVLLLIGR